MITPEYAESNFSAAKNAHFEALHLYKDYFREDDQMIDSLLTAKLNLIEASRCSFVTRTVDSLYKEANMKLKSEYFSEAGGDFNVIGELIDENPDCNIDGTILERRIEILNSIKTYYKKLDALKKEDSASLFIEKSFNLDRYFEENNLSPYIQAHALTLDRVLVSENEDLMSSLLEHYAKTSGDRQSLEILWEMRESGLKSKDLRIYQSELGKRLAAEDYKEDPGKDPYIKVNEYTLNYSFFKHLRRAYLAKWGELSGNEKKSSYIWRKIKKPFIKKK
jgi:hypothetical protein